MRELSWAIALLICVFFTISASATEEQSVFIDNTSFSIEKLSKIVKPQQVIIAHQPVYQNKSMSYMAFDMKALLSQLMHLNFNQDNANLFIEINTKDHYRSYIAVDDFVKKGRAYLAFRESINTSNSNKNWTLVKAHNQIFNPGPFYLVWDTTSTYPVGWPFQVTKIALVQKKDRALYTSFNPNNKALDKGFELFLNSCSACHSLYYQGTLGKAPDLGKVVSYLTDSDIHTIIKNGRDYMPAIGAQFSEQEITELLQFLHWVNEKQPTCQIN